MNDPSLVSCRLCPRECGADRTAGTGYCGAPAEVVAGRASLHMWEELRAVPVRCSFPAVR